MIASGICYYKSDFNGTKVTLFLCLDPTLKWWVDGSYNEILDRFLRPWGDDKEAQRHDGDWKGGKVLVEN